MSEKLKEWMRNSLGYASAAILAVAYVASALFRMNETGKSIEVIVADGLAYLLVGYALEQLLSLQGMINGERDPRVQATAALHAKTIESIGSWMDRLDDWCVFKTREALRTLRERVLMRCGMSYSHYFDDEGNALGYRAIEMPRELLPVKGERGQQRRRRKRNRRAFEKEEKRRYRAYRDALRVSVTPLVSGSLTGVNSGRDDPYDFGEGKTAHEARMMRKSVIWRIVTAALFGYYGIGLLEAFSYEELLFRVFQVSLGLAMAAVRQHQSFIFVTEEQRGMTVRKIDTLQMFAACMQREEREAMLCAADATNTTTVTVTATVTEEEREGQKHE